MTTLEIAALANQHPELGIKVAASGYISQHGKRISLETAQGVLRAAKPKANYSWDRLNANTQTFFFTLCEQIQEQTKDHSLTVPARIGKNGITLTLAQCPLLTNLKRAGLIEGLVGEKKSHKLVVLTDAGRQIWEGAR
jgi:hypothetical protein